MIILLNTIRGRQGNYQSQWYVKKQISSEIELGSKKTSMKIINIILLCISWHTMSRTAAWRCSGTQNPNLRTWNTNSAPTLTSPLSNLLLLQHPHCATICGTILSSHEIRQDFFKVLRCKVIQRLPRHLWVTKKILVQNWHLTVERPKGLIAARFWWRSAVNRTDPEWNFRNSAMFIMSNESTNPQ